MSITDLLAILPAPPSPKNGGLARAQTSLGINLPPDYADLVRCYGAGRIAGFLMLLQPDAPHPAIDLATQAALQIDVLRELADGGENMPYPLFPEPRGLLPIGMTDNGDAIYWRTAGEPICWTIAVHEARGPDWWAFDGDLTTFLAEVLTGRIRCPIFPESFPPSNPKFDALVD